MMKRNILWLCFVAALFTACNPYPRESERMEAAFSQADSVYSKGENDTVLFIPGLAEAASYFADKRQYGKAALAALYNGYAEKDYDKAEAMESFKEAEHYGEMACDSLTVARAQYQMGRMFYDDYMQKTALDYFKNAFVGFGQHYDEKALTMNMAACCFMLVKEYDSAAFYIEQSLHYADLGHSNIAKRKAMNNYAVLYELQGKYDQALDCLRLVKPENDKQQILNYLNLGDVFMVSGETDSANYYYGNLEKLLDISKVKDETMSYTYKALSEYAERQGKMSLAMEYRKKYEMLLDKIRDRIGQKNAYRIQQKYDYEALQNALNRKIGNRQRIIALLSVMASLILTALGGAMLRLSRIRESEFELKASLQRFTEQNRKLSGQSENYRSALENIQKELSKAITKEQRVMQKLAVYLDNPSDKSLLFALKDAAWGNEGFWAETFRLFDKQHPKLRGKLLQYYPNMSDQEQKILVLSGLNASREDSALLLQISVHMVDKLRNSVKKKVSNLPV